MARTGHPLRQARHRLPRRGRPTRDHTLAPRIWRHALVRFTDPAEAAASLDLREGDPAALGFYLDHDRVHVGDDVTCADAVFDAWSQELSKGRNCLMLAPTRDLVRELNVRAQAARGLSGQSVPVSDGCSARVGDVVVSRRNDRYLGISGTDWVKNGDRWIVTDIKHGAVSVRHRDSGLHARLPAAYVAAHVELGYASTVHTAQGLTADVMHGIATGDETRQTLYTMLTRGREENHVHVVHAEPAHNHALPSPALNRQATATELLKGILARDGAAVSATSTRTLAAAPETQLHDATIRYADALALAASRLRVDLEEAPDGPLPWLAGVPDEVASHSAWGPYLAARARRVATLTTEVRKRAVLPRWMSRYGDLLTPGLRGDLAAWRAANGIDHDVRTWAGPPPHDDREAAYHRHLVRAVDASYGDVLKGWEARIVQHVGRRDEHTMDLAKQLDQLQRRGVDAACALDVAATGRRLPTDRPTAALAYREREVAFAQQRTSDPRTRAASQRGGPSLGM